MKLQELLESTGSITPAKVQRVVYDYVLSKLTVSDEVKKELKSAFQNDGFWVTEFDNLYSNASRGNYDTTLDSLAAAIEAVAVSIKDHYSDPMNHEPGYKPQKIAIAKLELHSISSKDLDILITKIDPSMVDGSKKQKKSEIASKASVSKDLIGEVAAFVKKHDAASWKEYFAVLKKSKRVDDYLPPQFANGKLDVKSIKTAEELKNKFTELPNQDYVESVFDNIANLPEVEKSKDQSVKDLMQAFRTIAFDPSLSQKLFAKI